jgi:hypothetical protein
MKKKNNNNNIITYLVACVDAYFKIVIFILISNTKVEYLFDILYMYIKY